MEALIAITLLVGISYLMFKSGKQIGRRFGFRAGRQSRRRRFR